MIARDTALWMEAVIPGKDSSRIIDARSTGSTGMIIKKVSMCLIGGENRLQPYGFDPGPLWPANA